MQSPLLSSHLYLKVTFSCPVIVNLIWIEPLLRGHLSYKATISLPKGELLKQVWLAHTVTSIKQSSVFKGHLFSCPVIVNFIWIEPFLRDHLSYKATFSLPKGELLKQVWLAHVVTSIQQSFVFKGHLFLSCHSKFHMYWTSFKRPPVL